MNLSKILTFLTPFQGILKPELLHLEAAASEELKTLIKSHVSSPGLQQLLIGLDEAVDAFAQAQINKLG